MRRQTLGTLRLQPNSSPYYHSTNERTVNFMFEFMNNMSVHLWQTSVR